MQGKKKRSGSKERWSNPLGKERRKNGRKPRSRQDWNKFTKIRRVSLNFSFKTYG